MLMPLAPYLRVPRCFLAQRTTHALAKFPPGTMLPGAAPKAYQFLANQGEPKVNTVYGIGSFGGTVLMSDVAAFCEEGGFPLPDLKVSTVGGANPTSDSGGANVENQLDIQRIIESWNTAFPNTPAKIHLVIGPNIGTGISMVTQRLVDLGCTDISWSWGSARKNWGQSEISVTEMTFQKAVALGITIWAASGDNSIMDGTSTLAVDYPCGSPSVNAVGGTRLLVNDDGSYGSERAWGDGKPGDEGGGGGFDSYFPQPVWQQGVVPKDGIGIMRPDLSACADPKSGYQVYSDGAWRVVGGTSASAPLLCGYAGVLRALGGDLSNFQATYYKHRATAIKDITTGSNGSPAVTGPDIATGIGSPIGHEFAKLFPPGPTTPIDPPIDPPTEPEPPPDGAVTVVGTIVPGTDLSLESGKVYTIVTSD